MTTSNQVPAMKIRRARRLVTAVGLATVGILGALALSSPASADGVPAAYPVQGMLTGADGTPIDGPHDVVFRLHAQAEEGTALYQETHADLVVQNGSFVAYLGGGTPTGEALTSKTFEDYQDLWLEVAVDGEVITPRFKYGTVPYAAVAGKAENAAQLGGYAASRYTYAAGTGIALSSQNVISVADRGIDTAKLASGIAVDASRVTTTGNATVGGTLNVSGATTLAGATASTLSTTGATTLGGTLNVSGATTLASTTASTLTTTGAATLASGTVSGTLRVNGATTLAGMTASTLTTTGNTTLGGNLNVTGSTTLAGTTTGAATLASGTVSGNLDVNGIALLGLRQKDCDNATSCTCDLANERLLSGGAIGHLTDAALALNRFVYAQRATSSTTYGALCNVAGGNCARITVVCARIGS